MSHIAPDSEKIFTIRGTIKKPAQIFLVQIVKRFLHLQWCVVHLLISIGYSSDICKNLAHIRRIISLLRLQHNQHSFSTRPLQICPTHARIPNKFPLQINLSTSFPLKRITAALSNHCSLHFKVSAPPELFMHGTQRLKLYPMSWPPNLGTMLV